MPLVGTVGRALGAGILILALSAAVVWPAWALATRERGLFNALAAAALLASLALLAWSRRRRRRAAGPLPR